MSVRSRRSRRGESCGHVQAIRSAVDSYCIDSLERRLLLAYTGSVSGSTATLTGNSSGGVGDIVIITESGGFLVQNRATFDAGFNSALDFDSTQAGDQKIAADAFSTVNINTGAGPDQIQVGGGFAAFSSPASQVKAAVHINNGSANGKALVIADGLSSTGNTLNIIDGSITGTGIKVTYTGAGGFEGISVFGGSGTDTFNIKASTAAAYSLFGGSPTTPPGDVLNFNGQGSSATDNGTKITQSGKQDVNYSQFETVNLFNTAPTDLAVSKVLQTASPVTAGTNADYKITLTNNGADAYNVVLSDPIPSSMSAVSFEQQTGAAADIFLSGGAYSAKTSMLPAGATQEFLLTLGVRSNTASGTAITNTASVTSDTLDTVPDNDSGSAPLTVQTRADLAVTKTDDPDPVFAGGDVNYHIVATNNGPSDAQNVTIDDTIPAGLSFKSASGSQGSGTLTANSLSFHFGTIASGASASLDISFATDADTPDGTILTNQVTVSSATQDDNLSNNIGQADTTIVGPPTITVEDVSVVEGNIGNGIAKVHVSLSHAFNKDVTFKFTTLDGSATSADSDYADETGTASISAGQTGGDIPLDIFGDTKFEADETFNLAIGQITNAVAGDTTGTITIVNDDVPPPPPAQVSIDNVTVTEGNSGVKFATFTVSLDKISATPVTVQFATADGTATALSDYVAQSSTITFNPGELTKTIDIAIQSDTTVELDELFAVNLSNVAGGAQLADPQGIGTITNDDSAPVTPPPSSSPGKVSLGTDPCDSSKKALKIEGTDNNDTITVTKSGSAQGKAVVKINGSNKGTFSFSGSILVYGNGGNDNINIDLSISRTVFAWGGDGKDTISSGSGNDVLVGNGGNDSIKGNAGRDLLFGGDGADKLDGGSSDDILVAGGTSVDDNVTNLCKLLDEWKRTDKNYSQRVSHIINGGGLNGSVKLNASNIFSSPGLKDSLTGGSNTDLFFAAVPGDVLTDKVSGETVVDVG